jgi:hypothetical protein
MRRAIKELKLVLNEKRGERLRFPIKASVTLKEAKEHERLLTESLKRCGVKLSDARAPDVAEHARHALAVLDSTGPNQSTTLKILIAYLQVCV